MTVTLYQGDCLDYLRTLPSESVDAIVTDPPYGMNLQPQRQKTKAIRGDVRREAMSLWWATVPVLHRVAKNDTAHFFFGRWSETWAQEVLSQWFTVKGCVVWRKNQWGIGYYLRPQWELIWYCHKGTPPVPVKADSDVWDAKRESSPVHSCQKPVDLLERAVKYVCPTAATVLDPFMGVGTTGVACMRGGYNFIGCEIDPAYFSVAESRIAQAQPALRAPESAACALPAR